MVVRGLCLGQLAVQREWAGTARCWSLRSASLCEGTAFVLLTVAGSWSGLK